MRIHPGAVELVGVDGIAWADYLCSVMNFIDLYVPCVGCTLPCAGIINRNTDAAVDRRHIPRGFYSATEPGMRPVVMFISTNPGGGSDSFLEPIGAYDHPTMVENVNFQRGIVQGFFQKPARHFHRRLKIMAEVYLNMEWPKFAHHAVFTDLAKCTTPEDRAVPPETMNTCAKRHLSRELDAWNPVILVAIGADPYNWLNGEEGAPVRSNRPLRKLPHPSFYGRGINDAWFAAKARALRRNWNPDQLLRIGDL